MRRQGPGGGHGQAEATVFNPGSAAAGWRGVGNHLGPGDFDAAAEHVEAVSGPGAAAVRVGLRADSDAALVALTGDPMGLGLGRDQLWTASRHLAGVGEHDVFGVSACRRAGSDQRYYNGPGGVIWNG